MKTILKVIAGILAAALIVYGVGWCITGNYDPTKWSNRSEQETPAGNDEDKPADGGAATANVHTHNHALSASSDEDENAGIELYSSDITTYIGERAECPLCGSWAYFFDPNPSVSPCEFNGTYRCDNSEDCGWVSSRIVGTFHDYSWEITTAPTKDTLGVASYKCSRCSEVTDTRAVYALPDNPEKEGYHFVGWYFDEGFTRPYDNSPIYDDTQLYAKFEINVYTVTFDSAGGSSVESQQVNWNESVTLPDSEREGYTVITTKVIEITQKVVGYCTYDDGVQLDWGKTEGITKAYFVAFSTDRPIEKLISADLTFFATKSKCKICLNKSHDHGLLYDFQDPEYIDYGTGVYNNTPLKITYTQKFSNQGGGNIRPANKYSWNRIRKRQDFVNDNNNKDYQLLTGAETELSETQWVLNFYEAQDKYNVNNVWLSFIPGK